LGIGDPSWSSPGGDQLAGNRIRNQVIPLGYVSRSAIAPPVYRAALLCHTNPATAAIHRNPGSKARTARHDGECHRATSGLYVGRRYARYSWANTGKSRYRFAFRSRLRPPSKPAKTQKGFLEAP